MNNTVKMFQVGNKWYFSIGKWKGTTGPFDSILAASEAASMELQSQYGKKENSILNTEARRS